MPLARPMRACAWPRRYTRWPAEKVRAGVLVAGEGGAIVLSACGDTYAHECVYEHTRKCDDDGHM